MTAKPTAQSLFLGRTCQIESWYSNKFLSNRWLVKIWPCFPIYKKSNASIPPTFINSRHCRNSALNQQEAAETSSRTSACSDRFSPHTIKPWRRVCVCFTSPQLTIKFAWQFVIDLYNVVFVGDNTKDSLEESAARHEAHKSQKCLLERVEVKTGEESESNVLQVKAALGSTYFKWVWSKHMRRWCLCVFRCSVSCLCLRWSLSHGWREDVECSDSMIWHPLMTACCSPDWVT